MIKYHIVVREKRCKGNTRVRETHACAENEIKRNRKRAHGGNSDVNNVKKKRDYCDTRKLSQKFPWNKLFPYEEREREKTQKS